MAMVSLKRDVKVEPSDTMLVPSAMREEYPYGCCLSLDEETLTKLGMTELPKAGSTITFTAQARVASTSVRSEAAEPGEGEGAEKERRVELQITNMDLGAGATRSPESVLYREA